jgi:hypothetical protein
MPPPLPVVMIFGLDIFSGIDYITWHRTTTVLTPRHSNPHRANPKRSIAKDKMWRQIVDTSFPRIQMVRGPSAWILQVTPA